MDLGGHLNKRASKKLTRSVYFLNIRSIHLPSFEAAYQWCHNKNGPTLISSFRSPFSIEIFDKFYAPKKLPCLRQPRVTSPKLFKPSLFHTPNFTPTIKHGIQISFLIPNHFRLTTFTPNTTHSETSSHKTLCLLTFPLRFSTSRDGIGHTSFAIKKKILFVFNFPSRKWRF